MALGNFFKKQEGSGPEHFWSLVIGKTWVQAAIWRVVGEAAEVVSEGSTANWQDGNDESLLEAADGSLSAAAAAIGDDVSEPNKVVFGLSPSWIQEGTIVQERLGILKKLSNELELTPAGFVVIPEAITHYLKSKEGAPLNAILVGLAEDAIDVTLVQNGRGLGTVEVAQSISLGSDIAEGLSRLPSVSQYPSRILLYNHKVGNLEDARQNILDTNWESVKVPFLHTPKVEILAEDVAVTAVSLAGGAEVGEAKSVVLPDSNQDLDEPEETQEIREPEDEVKTEVSAEEIGFVRDRDVADQEVVPVQETQLQEITPVRSAVVDYATGEPSLPERAKVGSLFSGLASVFSSIRFPSFGLRSAGMLSVFGIGIVLLLAGGGLFYWYYPTSKVTIIVAPKKLEKTLKLTVDPKLTVVNQADKIVPGVTKDAKVTGDKTASTTGERIVGDRAKGQITIGHVGGSALLKTGTILTGPNGLKFTLDNDTTVASGSGVFTPSKTQAAISAADIGAQYNLASGSKFSVGSFSKDSFEAQNDNAFSGGTSRSVSAVSEEDRLNLEKELTAELLTRGLEDLKSSLEEREVIIQDSATLIADTREFSHKAGDETSNLKLTLAGRAAVMVVSQDSVNVLVMSDLEKDVSQGYALKADQISVTYTVVKVQPKTGVKKTTQKQAATPLVAETKIDPNSPINLEAQIIANLLPKIDPIEIARAISGKQTAVAREYLATTPGYVRADIFLTLRLPGKLETLPRIAKNIIVEVASDQ